MRANITAGGLSADVNAKAAKAAKAMRAVALAGGYVLVQRARQDVARATTNANVAAPLSDVRTI